jgi:hypothetical protein
MNVSNYIISHVTQHTHTLTSKQGDEVRQEHGCSEESTSVHIPHA